MRIDQITDWNAANSPDVRLVLALFRARNHIWEANHLIVAEQGLTWAQSDTLVVLRLAPPPHVLRPSQMYDAIQVTSGGMTKVLKGLVAQGMVRRLADPRDARSQMVALTDAGKTRIEMLVDRLSQSNAALLDAVLSPDEQAQLSDMLARLCHSLDNPDKSNKQETT